MRIGGTSAAAAAPLLLGACALPAEPRKSCTDSVSVGFPSGAAQLNLDAVGQVLLAVATLDACPSARATVTGHAGRGEAQVLGTIRARNVAAVLAKNGVDRGRIEVVGSAKEISAKPDNRFVTVAWR